MNLLKDILTYIRRIIKSPSNASITDQLLIDYVNRFWMMDVDARIQLFDLKTKYQFVTSPGVDRYNMPLYNVQPYAGQVSNYAGPVGIYPVYQGFLSPCYINGIQVPMQTQKNQFENIWPNVVQNAPVIGVGNGTAGPYTLQFPIVPFNSVPLNTPLNALLRGHVDITGIIATGVNVDPPVSTTINPLIPSTSIDAAVFFSSTDATGANIVVTDSGQFLTGAVNYGLLMAPGTAPFGYTPLAGGYSTTLNTINYLTGVATNVYFPSVIPAGININAQSYYFQTGLPRAILYYNNTITLRSPPDQQYVVELEAYLSPSAFLNTANAIPFGYMAEYIARGAARKIMADTGDQEQLMFYEPFFREQEMLVWKRSQRQWTASRTETIYSQGINQGQSGFNNIGGSTV
jgi:hypothetical protein